MKVLILATDIFTRGGIARYTSALASSLGGMLGPENVDVLSFFDWGHADWGHTGDLPSEFRLLGTVCGRARAGAWSRMRFMSKAAMAGFRGYDLVIANHQAPTLTILLGDGEGGDVDPVGVHPAVAHRLDHHPDGTTGVQR